MGKEFALELIPEFALKLLSYLPTTLVILTVGISLGIVIGLLLAIPRIYRVPVLNVLAYLFISYCRGTPILVQLFIAYFGLPQLLLIVGLDLSRVEPIYFVTVAYGLSWGALMSENIRASIASVDQGQIDAAHALGMTSFDAFRRVIIPQALVVALPNFANLVFMALKGTSLAYAVGVHEILFRVNSLGSALNHFFEAYLAAAIIYYAIYLILAKLFAGAERQVGSYMLGTEKRSVARRRIWRTG
ncbi:MAG: amino acid ABC transporter permease [Coriobacteriales bacterium]|jgi:L-cystine transport system permease protein|nr:amino acid ABC transporter permease [Coriobacteriales bacterium]